MNISGKKMIIAGIHGTGKTYLARHLSKNFKAIVYSPYKEEWVNESVFYIEHKDFLNEFPFWCSKVKEFAKKNKINMFIVDDSDILFKHHFDTSQELRELHIGHRHFGKSGLTILYLTRRIQDIPTKIYGSCEFMALFTIDSPQTVDLLNRYYDNLGGLVKQIPYGSYQFILKEIGKEPKTMII